MPYSLTQVEMISICNNLQDQNLENVQNVHWFSEKNDLTLRLNQGD